MRSTRATRFQKDREYIATPRLGCTNILIRAGGVYVVGTGGRIDIDNTLEERLKILETDALPTIRVLLFGENKNRKFHD